MKKVVLFLFSFVIYTTAHCQSTYTISSSTGQGFGSVYDAFNFANLEMGLGNNVVILFNAPSLCVVEVNYLPPLSTSNNVLLTLKKDPSATNEQGIILSPNDYLNPTIARSVSFNGNNMASMVIEELVLKNLSFPGANFPTRTGLNTKGVQNLTLLQNKFINSRVFVKGNVAFLMRNNELSEVVDEANFNFRAETFSDYKVSNNTILENVDLTIFNLKSNASLNISNNSFANNSISNNRHGLTVFNPLTSWVIDNNIFNNSGFHIGRFPYSINAFNVGLNLVAPNTLGYTIENSNNSFNRSGLGGAIWTTCPPNSSGQFFEDGISVVGLSIEGQVIVTGEKYTSIRGNAITNLSSSAPIKLKSAGANGLSSFGNLRIPKPIISSTTSSSTSLSFSYSFPPQTDPYFLDAVNESFVIDVYTSNANYDLVNYIGNITVPAQSYNVNIENVTISLNGNSVNSGNKVAFTVTSLGDVNQLPLGTSEVAYSTVAIAPPCDVSIDMPTEFCAGTDLTFTANSDVSASGYSWTLNNGVLDDTSVSIALNLTLEIQQYNIGVDVYGTNGEFCHADTSFTLIDCDTIPPLSPAFCETCITSFSPTPGDYMVSAWVKVKEAPFGTLTYTEPSLNISFLGDVSTFNLIPSGQIIDEWQRIEAVITVPTAATGINIELSVTSGVAFFDDIRFYPFDGSMMSYVYDPISLRLMAELDERNYATLYEYDEEGKLVRVKKETERGVMTIQENRDNIKKR